MTVSNFPFSGSGWTRNLIDYLRDPNSLHLPMIHKLNLGGQKFVPALALLKAISVIRDATVKPPGGSTALTLLIVARVLTELVKKAGKKT